MTNELTTLTQTEKEQQLRAAYALNMCNVKGVALCDVQWYNLECP